MIERLLRWVTDAPLADAIAGDLRELRHQRARVSLGGAAVWYWRTSLGLAIYLAARRMGESMRNWFADGFQVGGHRGELRHAIRSLRCAPGYSLAVAGVLALSLALAIAAFRLADGILFKPLPYPRAHELYSVSGGYSPEVVAAAGQTRGQSSGLLISARDVADLRAAVPEARFTMTGGASGGGTLGDLREWSPYVVRVDEQFFDVLGVRPLIGGFEPADFDTPADAVQPGLVTYRVWQRQLDGRPDAVGRILATQTAAGAPVRYRVAGVLPRDFLYPASFQQPDVITPLVPTPSQRTQRTQRSFQAYVRLPPGVPLADYQTRFDEVGRAGREEIPDRTLNGGLGYWDRWALTSLTGTLGTRQRPTFLAVFAAAGVLLLLGCLNVSGLAAARGLDRVRELSLRRALGARARDIARLVVLECALLIAAGCALGLAISEALVRLALRLLPPNLGLLRDPGLDWRVAAFVAAAAAVSTLLVAIWPVWRSLRPQTTQAMGAATTPRLAGRSVLIAAQVALALVLTIGGALVVSSLIRIWQTDVGFASEGLLVVDGTSTATAPDARLSALRDLLDRIGRLAGVSAAGATQIALLRSGSPGGEFKGDTYRVTHGFFEAVAPKLVEGRFPTAEELATAQPVAVVSRTFASAYFPDGPAVGRSIATHDGKETFTVVGLVEDARYAAWTSTGMGGRQFYRALTDGQRFSIVARLRPGADGVLGDVLRLSGDVPAIRLTRAAMADDLLADTVRAERFRSWLFGSFSVAALAIVGAGILGLVATTAARRTREVGIRLALGATAAGVVRLLLREQLVAVAVGLAAGAVVSSWAVGMVESYLYEIESSDARVWAAAMAVIAGVAAIGVLIPAAKLGRTDPVGALRQE